MNPFKKIVAGLGAGVLALGLAACATSSGGDDGAEYPTKDLDWTIAFGPGGGNDLMSRKLAEIIEAEDLYPGGNVVLENREGGSGATGWSYLFSQKGNPYGVSTTSGSFLTTPLQADTGWDYSSFTHVALLAADNSLFIVSEKSGIEDWESWVDYAKNTGKKVAVGGIGTVNVDFIVQAKLAEQAGYEIDYVPFNDEGQLQSSLSSGAIDSMISQPGSIIGQIEGGRVNALLFSGPERLDALKDVPTSEELGIDELPSMPRGFILPPDVSDEAREWWIATLQEVVETEAWQDYLDTNYLVSDERWGDDFSTYLEQTVGEFKTTLTDLGAL